MPDDAAHEPPDQDPAAPGAGPATGGRAQAERELRVAVLVAIAVLLVGQGLVLAGLAPVALIAIGLPGTIVAVVLARRWTRLADEGDGTVDG